MKPDSTFPEDAALIRQAKSGNNSARTTLLQKYLPLINSLAFRYSGDLPDEEREDLAQEATIAFFHALEEFDTGKETSFGSFAKKCISNRLKDYLRRRIKNPTKNALPLDWDGDSAFGTDEWFKQFFDAESLKTILAKLPQILSEFEYHVWMLHFTGYSTAEIATAKGTDRKSVENALARARNKIKKNLSHL